jgi:hypothetical protein
MTMTLSTLPVIIDGPGQYRTRGGKPATVDKVRTENSDKGLPAPTFAAAGYISHQTVRGGHTSVFSTWHVSGRAKAKGLHSTDIVGKE